MSAKPNVVFSLASIVLLFSSHFAYGRPATSSTALSFAAQSISALTGGNAISDVTLTGTVTWTAGSDSETGTATLLAVGSAESRMSLSLTSGARTEIRDAQTGNTLGSWTGPGGSSGAFALFNCQTDAVWFFPAFSSLTAGPNVVFSYVGLEVRNGESVQHLQSYVPNPTVGSGINFQQLSTEDFYLDATTLLPSAIRFSAHPDNNAASNISVEVDFSNYQTVNGAAVPMHIQKYLQGTLQIDLTVTSATFNTGIALSNFTIN
jgi:hypothetical protein